MSQAKREEWTLTHELLASIVDRLGLIAAAPFGVGLKKPPERLRRPWEKDQKRKGMSAVGFARALAAAGQRRGR